MPRQPDRPRRLARRVLLLNHVSHDVANPYRASHAIFVTEGAEEPAEYVDEVPPVFGPRVLSLRGFDADGMMADAAADPAGRGRRRHPQAVRQPGDRDHPRPQRDARLLRRQDRKELTMASLAPAPDAPRSAAHGQRLAPRCGHRLGGLHAPRPELGRARHRRGQDDRHLLQAELPGAAAQARECRILR